MTGARATALLMVGLPVSLNLAACYQQPQFDNEPVLLLLSGPCAGGADRRIAISTTAQWRLAIEGLEGTDLPVRGAFSRYPSFIRDGAWFLAGSSCETCLAPEQFRLCTARRVDWQIELTCIDGLARPVCAALLREAEPPAR
jgi:hypothetical protein